MDEPRKMHCRQCPAHILAYQHRFSSVQDALRFEHALERFASHEFHAKTDAIPMGLHTEDADDVGMPDLRERASFVEETFLQLVVGESSPENLDGDFTLQLRIPRAVDSSEGPLADLL